jgi:outer membrane lipoprotein-sorting protein
MKSLRTVSTRRLLALIVAFMTVVAAGTAIAVAASSGGPVPPAKPLAQAIHDALAAPPVNAISARVTFTNHLIDSSSIQCSDPILTGASGRLWISADRSGKSLGRIRLELQADNGDAQAVLDNGSFWVYDPSSRTVYRGKLPQHAASAAKTKPKHEGVPTVAQIEKDLTRLMQHANVSAAQPTDVAGQAAYSVRVSPKHDGGLLGSAALAWDAVRGIPLRIGVYARGSSSPVLELKVTHVSYGAVPASVFNAAPPSGAKVVNVSVPAGKGVQARMHRLHAGKGKGEGKGKANEHAAVTGVAAVARHLPFSFSPPRQLVGLPQQSVRLLDWGGSAAALVTYGQNLGGIAVIEQTADSAKTATKPAAGEHQHGLNLPTVSINGVTGQELDTALGTVVRFTRGGVAYTVLGAVPPAAADAAARGL